MTRKVILEKQIILFVIRYDIWNGTIESNEIEHQCFFRNFQFIYDEGWQEKIRFMFRANPFFVKFSV